MINWDNYEIYDPGVFGPPNTLPRAEARIAFNRLMAAKAARIEMLRQLMQDNGVELRSSDGGLCELNEWFLANVEPNPDERGRLLSTWYSVVSDIGLFLGEVVIERCPGLRWEFFTWGKKDVAYQNHVIMGFSRLANPKYNIEFDRNVASYAHSIIASRGSFATEGKVNVRGVEIDVDAATEKLRARPVESDAFPRWVKTAKSHA